jgi:hypothetical protein
MGKGKQHVFVCYARADADRLAPMIRSLRDEGLEIWRDQEGIEGATFWRKEIVDAIMDCAVVLFFASENSCASDNISKELALASEEKKPILPVFIEDVEPSAELRYQIAGVQHIAAHTNPEQSLRQIIVALRRYAPTSRRKGTEPAIGPNPPRPVRSKSRVVILAAVAIAVVLSFIATYTDTKSSPAPSTTATTIPNGSVASTPQSGQSAIQPVQLTGAWYIETLTKTSDYIPYLDMRLRFKVLLTQDGTALDARGEKIGEVTDGEERELSGSAKTAIHLTGHIHNGTSGLGTILFSGDESSTARSDFSTMFELQVDSPDQLTGTFKSMAANSGGDAMWISEKQWLVRGWDSQ